MDTLTAYSSNGIPLPTLTGPYCGTCGGRRAGVRHIDVAAIRTCAAYTADQEWATEDCRRAETAYERHLEDRGYDDARAQDDYEARNGVIGFIEAWHASSPETCPCDDPIHGDALNGAEDEPDTTCHCGHPDCGAC